MMAPASPNISGGQGSNWIRAEKRRRIYERDGWRCVWCQREVYSPRVKNYRDGALLATLDHVVPRTEGGTNDASNLLTCCDECNRNRGNTKPAAWAYELAAGDRDADEMCAVDVETFVINVLERALLALTTPLPDAKPKRP